MHRRETKNSTESHCRSPDTVIRLRLRWTLGSARCAPASAPMGVGAQKRSGTHGAAFRPTSAEPPPGVQTGPCDVAGPRSRTIGVWLGGLP
jgi:hypothetical protein